MLVNQVVKPIVSAHDLILLRGFLNFQRKSARKESNLSGLLKGLFERYGLNNLDGEREIKKIQEEILKDLAPLITLPDENVIQNFTSTEIEKGLSEPTKNAMLSGYRDRLGLLLQKIERNLNVQLKIALADREAVQRQAKRKRGLIRTRWGKLIVEGELGKIYIKSISDHLYLIIAESLLSGKFSLLRQCRECGKVFLCDRVRKSFCSNECDNVYCSRNSERKYQTKLRREEREDLRERGRPPFSMLAKQIRESKSTTFINLLEEIRDLSKIRNALGEKWEEFEPVVREVINSDASQDELIWNTLSVPIQKSFCKLAVLKEDVL